jgi:hypothetical protein
VVKTETYGGIAALNNSARGLSRSSTSRQKIGAGALKWTGSVWCDAAAFSAFDINETLSFPQTIVSNAIKPVAPRRAAGEIRMRRPVIRRTAAPDALETRCNQCESTIEIIEIIRGMKLIKPSEAKKCCSL